MKKNQTDELSSELTWTRSLVALALGLQPETWLQLKDLRTLVSTARELPNDAIARVNGIVNTNSLAR